MRLQENEIQQKCPLQAAAAVCRTGCTRQVLYLLVGLVSSCLVSFLLSSTILSLRPLPPPPLPTPLDATVYTDLWRFLYSISPYTRTEPEKPSKEGRNNKTHEK